MKQMLVLRKDLEWRPVVGHPGYEISTGGDVRSLDREVITKAGVRKFYKGRLLSPWLLGPKGKQYRAVTFPGGDRRKIPALMLETFVGPRPSPEHVVRHWDDDKMNDTLGNLLWGTKSDNTYDSIRNGTHCSQTRKKVAS